MVDPTKISCSVAIVVVSALAVGAPWWEMKKDNEMKCTFPGKSITVHARLMSKGAAAGGPTTNQAVIATLDFPRAQVKVVRRGKSIGVECDNAYFEIGEDENVEADLGKLVDADLLRVAGALIVVADYESGANGRMPDPIKRVAAMMRGEGIEGIAQTERNEKWELIVTPSTADRRSSSSTNPATGSSLPTTQP